MADIVGPVPVKLNGRYSITIKNFSYEKATPTKVHAGAFGNYGTSQGAIKNITGSFMMSIPKTGPEFDVEKEFAGVGGGRIVAEVAPGLFPGLSGVKLNKLALAVAQEEGTTTWTTNFTAESDRPVG